MFDTHLMLFGYIARTFVYPYGQYAIHILYVSCYYYFTLSIFFGFYPLVDKIYWVFCFKYRYPPFWTKTKKLYSL